MRAGLALFFFFSSRRRHTRCSRDWSSDVCSSDLRDQSAKRDPLAGLSAQERKILELIGEGLTNRQIGERMFLAEKTVKNYVSALFAKHGMESRTQAAAYAARSFEEHEKSE